MTAGTLYGVSLGPGDPDLITRKAARLLDQVPVWAVPVRAPGRDSFALDIVRRGGWDPQGRTVAELHFPMRKDPDYLAPYHRQAAEQVAAHLDAGQDVAFLTEGDASTYATWGHLAGALAEARPELERETVPGVTSYAATAAATDMPLMTQDDKLAVLPATYGIEVIDDVLDAFDGVVLMKVKPVLDELIDRLDQRGLLPHAAFASRIGTPDEAIVTDVAALRGTKPDYLSLVVVRNPYRAQEPRISGCRSPNRKEEPPS